MTFENVCQISFLNILEKFKASFEKKKAITTDYKCSFKMFYWNIMPFSKKVTALHNERESKFAAKNF